MKQNFYKCVRLAAGLLLCVSLTFCSGKAGGKPVSSSSRSVGDAESTPQNVAGQDAFPFPAIPETMTEPQKLSAAALLGQLRFCRYGVAASCRRDGAGAGELCGFGRDSS